MSDEERISIICMYCGDIIADIAKSELKDRNEFYCATCNQTIKIKTLIRNVDGFGVYLN